MGLQLQNFPLVFTLAAMVLTPAFGQAVPPTVGAANGGSESAESIPDFSGPWVHPLPGFEPLPSGPTALVNRSRRPNGTGDILKLAGDHTNPILKPEAAEVVKGHGELGLNGIGDPNPRNQCWPGGVPFVFTNIGMQMFQQPDKITIFYSDDHEVRNVRMNEPHPAQVTPSWYGDSVGHYANKLLPIWVPADGSLSPDRMSLPLKRRLTLDVGRGLPGIGRAEPQARRASRGSS